MRWLAILLLTAAAWAQMPMGGITGSGGGGGASPVKVEVQAAALPNTASGTATVTLGTPTTAGELIVVAAFNIANNAFPASPVSDSGSQSYTAVYTFTSSGVGAGGLWYAVNSASGITSVSVTEAASSGHGSIWVGHWKNMSTASPVDVSATLAAAGSSPWASTSITTTHASDVLIGFGMGKFNGANCNMTLTGSWTSDSLVSGTNWDGGNGGQGVFGDQTVAATGSYQFTGTDSGTCTHNMASAAFKGQ